LKKNSLKVLAYVVVKLIFSGFGYTSLVYKDYIITMYILYFQT